MTIDDITQPFAVQGDRQNIPLDPTADNKLSWLSGFTYLYELKPEESDVEPYILRRDFNEIIYLITAKMLDMQTKLEADVGTALDTKLDKDEYYRDKPYFVTTNTTQTISAQKTFTGNIYFNKTPTGATQAVNKSYADTKVALTGNQTITGTKTFSSIPVCATQPNANNQLANKAYVDTKVSLSGNQTISGLKTFATAPRSNTDPINNNDLVRLSYLKSNTPGLAGKRYIDVGLVNYAWTNNTGRAVFFIYTILNFPEDHNLQIYFNNVVISSQYDSWGGISYQCGIIVPNGTKISFSTGFVHYTKYLPL